ncbi:hypothetical protein [Jeongeupia sp. USM3]|uniref:hypothetical protein n=1 Tax=Jeongeupia sp. USM3 TaxID=1906741 RepID=UPI0011AB8C27|nr:hypothetical protein [Jeongeupia sp. USM3]
MSEPNERFSLDAIERERAKLEAAKKAAIESGKRDQTHGLVALTNLPWLIAAAALAYWYFFR